MAQLTNNYLLTLSYDGSGFNGWVIQPHGRTVQQVLEQALRQLLKKAPFKVVGASKTDQGVHACDQKVLLTLPFVLPNPASFQDGLNRSLPLDVRVQEITRVEAGFNVRQVQQKTYCYTINDAAFDVFTQRYELHWTHGTLDLVKLTTLFNLFVGEYDYFYFSGLSEQERTLIQTKRRITSIKVCREAQKVKIYFQAKGFIRYQIRMIIGAVLACYLGHPQSKQAMIVQRLQGLGDRSPFKVPGNGLCLVSIVY